MILFTKLSYHHGHTDRGLQNTVAQPSIARHPLFPAIVATWFAALLSLGSLAVRPALLEAMVLKVHADLLIPAAAPPLGLTARLLLALALAALGAGLGAAVVRRIAAPAPQKTAVSTEPPAAPVTRRRALALTPETPAFVPHEPAPLPGVLDIAGMGLGEPMRAPLDLTDFDAPEIPETPTPPVAERQVFGLPPTADVMAAPPEPVDAPALPDLALRLRSALETRRTARVEAAPAGDLPAALRPLDLAAPDPEEDAPTPIAPRHLALPTAQVPLAELGDVPLATFGTVGSDAGEPLVIFPGQPGTAIPVPIPASAPPPADPAETERALRAALASLQRVSGAA